MFDILKKVRSVATPENYNAVVDTCSWVAAAVRPSSGPEKVEAVSASKLKTFVKCDSSYMFSLYTDKPKDGTYFVVYVPRSLNVWRTGNQEEAVLLRDQLNNLKSLMNALEKVNSKSFAVQLERLRHSVQENPAFGDIHHAAACNFPNVIIKLCENQDELPGEASADGLFPLQIAVKNEAKEAVQVLLSLGADVAKADCRLRNAVHYGAEKSPAILRLLLSAPNFQNAVDGIDEDGLSPLCLAIFSGKAECVEVLLDADCSTGPFPAGPLAAMVIVAAASPELPKIVDLLLERAPNFLTERMAGSTTILHEKLEHRLLYHILTVLGDAVNADARNELGETPLYCAVDRNDLSQSIALLASNADVNAADNEGNTPLHIACQKGYNKLVKLLLCFGASVRLANERGATPLDVGKHSKEIMKCLRLFAGSPTVARPVLANVLSEEMQERALEERRQMSSDQRKKLVNFISLDGGGIKGLILIQILLHLEKLLGHSILEHFHWFAGTSTGAMIALALARGESLRNCQSLYLKMKDEIFVGRRPYSEEIIEKFLRMHFGGTTTMAELGSKKVLVTSTSVQTNPPKLKLFRNYVLPLDEAANKALGFDDPRQSFVWKCARYSSAAPTFFPPKDSLVDGGLMSNNPTLDLMTDIHTYNAACFKERKEPLRVGCILSLGTGQPPVEEIKDAKFNFGLPRGIREGMSIITDLISLKNILVEQITASNGECVTRARSWAHDQSVPFFRFSPPLSCHVELDETNNEVIVEFLWDTEEYLRTNGRRDVECLVQYLKSL